MVLWTVGGVPNNRWRIWSGLAHCEGSDEPGGIAPEAVDASAPEGVGMNMSFWFLKVEDEQETRTHWPSTTPQGVVQNGALRYSSP